MLTDRRNLALAPALAGPLQVVDVEALDASDRALPSRSGPGDLALLLYTSGSTGAPKGIVQSHRNVLHDTMHYTNRGRFTHEDRLLLISSVSFAASLRTIYTALLNGASLHPFDVNTEGFPRLAQWMREQAITIYRSVPTVFRYFASTLTGTDQFPALRLLYLGGEPVSGTDVELYRRHFGRGCVLVNRLGSTETLTYRSCFIDHDTPIPDGPVPVGYPVPGKEVLIVDADGCPVPPGEAGEIVVRSRYLSPGFWRQPERTRAVFALDPDDLDVRRYRTGDLGRLEADGCLFHLGRIDFEVKIRGHRVEMPGVETALRAVDGVRDAVVVAQRRGQHDSLVAYIVPTTPRAPDVSTLRRVLAGQLPDYMVPATYVVLDALPLLPSGKVDRRALPEPTTERPELAVSLVAPRNEVEAALAAIWAEVLGLDAIGVHDEFLDLGGDSLSASRIIARVTDQFEAHALRSALVGGLDRRPDGRGAGQGGPSRRAGAARCPLSLGRRPRFRDGPRTGTARCRSPSNACGFSISSSPADRPTTARSPSASRDGSFPARSPTRSPRSWPGTRRSAPPSPPATGFRCKSSTLRPRWRFPRSTSPTSRPKNGTLLSPGAWPRRRRARSISPAMACSGRCCSGSARSTTRCCWSCITSRPTGGRRGSSWASWPSSTMPPTPRGPPGSRRCRSSTRTTRCGSGRGCRARCSSASSPTGRPSWPGRPPCWTCRSTVPARPSRAGRAASHPVTLPRPLTDALKALGRQHRVTLFMTLLAAWQILLARYSRQEDILIGAPIAGRTRVQTEPVIGFFVNTLVMRTSLAGDPTVGELLGRVRSVCVEAYAHQELPFEKLVEELHPERNRSHPPLVQAVLAFDNTPEATLGFDGLRVSRLPTEPVLAKFDLVLALSANAAGAGRPPPLRRVAVRSGHHRAHGRALRDPCAGDGRRPRPALLAAAPGRRGGARRAAGARRAHRARLPAGRARPRALRGPGRPHARRDRRRLRGSVAHVPSPGAASQPARVVLAPRRCARGDTGRPPRRSVSGDDHWRPRRPEGRRRLRAARQRGPGRPPSLPAGRHRRAGDPHPGSPRRAGAGGAGHAGPARHRLGQRSPPSPTRRRPTRRPPRAWPR